jgi:long-chain acyl-CoA synthetase
VSVTFLLERFESEPDALAFVWRGEEYRYGWLRGHVDEWRRRLERSGVSRGAVVAIESDFSPSSVASLLALVEMDAILVPLTGTLGAKKSEFREIAEVEWSINPNDDDDGSQVVRRDGSAHNKLLLELRARRHPGLVLFSSGSTGKSKAALHDLVPLLRKFEDRRRPWRTIAFLLFDHIGGFNTLFYSLSNLGCLVIVETRAPDEVCHLIDQYRVEMLPTSPTFLNLMLASCAHERHDVSSLELVTYGTEPMPEATLHRLHDALPNVQLKQTYGLSELGILRSRSRSSTSLWIKIGGEGFDTRVVHGLLEIKAESAMLGYLNAPSPFTDDGWFQTGDAVEVDAEYLRILGRESELVNVGGEKVYPAEVEGVIQSMDGVVDVLVTGDPHPLVGQVVVAQVQLSTDESLSDFRVRMRQFCRARLDAFKVPQKVVLSRDDLHGQRFKKLRFSSST